jgi:succinate dehydrogenase/fumarate reductase flavoprotein subunit
MIFTTQSVVVGAGAAGIWAAVAAQGDRSF